MTETHATARTLERSAKMFQDERELLANLVYRGRNQHRAFGWWQKMVHTHKLATELSSAVAEWQQGLCAGRIVHAAVHKLLNVIDKTYFAVRQIIQLESFMALTMSLAAILARLKAMSEIFLQRIPNSGKKRSSSAAAAAKQTKSAAPSSATPQPNPDTSTSSVIAPDSQPKPQPPSNAAARPKPKANAKRRDDIDEIFGDL